MGKQKKIPVIYGACGHRIYKIPYRPEAVAIELPGGVHSISWQTLCLKCRKRYRAEGKLLDTPRKQDDWLHSGKTNNPERFR